MRRALLVDLLLASTLSALIVRAEAVGLEWRLVLAAVAAAAVLLRRGHPLPVLAAITAVVSVGVVTGRMFPTVGLALGVLMYSFALHSRVRRPWLSAAVVSAAVCLPGLLLHFDAWWRLNSLAVPVWIVGGAAIGDAIRSRRAYIAEVTERALQAEKTREEEARRRVIDERLRIARELHDVVAHHIAVISVQAGAATHVLRHDPEQVWPVLTHIRSAADTVLAEIQSVVGVLRDPNEVASTEPTPGMERLPALLEDLRTVGFRVILEPGSPRELPTMTDMAAFRIVQEALTNAHRHGDGTASLTLTYTEEELRVEVLNRVRPNVSTGSGFGLIGMRERAAAARGTLTTGPTPDGRFRVRAVLPLAEAAADSGGDA